MLVYPPQTPDCFLILAISLSHHATKISSKKQAKWGVAKKNAAGIQFKHD